MTTDGWSGILAEGETILWQGQPDGALAMDWSRATESAMGAFFVLFSLVWMGGAAKAGGFFWTFGLIFLAVGVWNALQPNLIDTLRRRRTWYTLTDRRAFIATDLPGQGRRLAAYPITDATMIELDLPGANGLGAVWFATRSGDWTWNRSRPRREGFARIPDPQKVAALMRDIQARDRKAMT